MPNPETVYVVPGEVKVENVLALVENSTNNANDVIDGDIPVHDTVCTLDEVVAEVTPLNIGVLAPATVIKLATALVTDIDVIEFVNTTVMLAYVVVVEDVGNATRGYPELIAVTVVVAIVDPAF